MQKFGGHEVCKVADVFDVMESPIVLHPDSFVPYKQISIRWSPEVAADSNVSANQLVDELLAYLRTALLQPYDKGQNTGTGQTSERNDISPVPDGSESIL